MFHTETCLHFTRRSGVGESYRFDSFFITVASWATQEQANLAWKVATIAAAEGWSLEERKEAEESFENAPRIYPSLCFSVHPMREERVAFTFYPAQAATFDHTLLERG